jgi:hypothetical protein
MLEGEPEEALRGFQEVVCMEGEKGEWCDVPRSLPDLLVSCFSCLPVVRLALVEN